MTPQDTVSDIGSLPVLLPSRRRPLLAANNLRVRSRRTCWRPINSWRTWKTTGCRGALILCIASRSKPPAGPRIEDHYQTGAMRFRTLQPSLAALLLAVAACGDGATPATPTSAVPAATVAARPAVPYDLQGHRGARGLRPENTLPAFEAALDLLVTTLEADVHLTADGQVVVWHDPVIDPSKCGLTPASPAGLPDPDDPRVAGEELRVRALTAGRLAGYRCDRNPDPGRFPRQITEPGAVAGDDYGIATVSELFEFVASYAASPDKTDEQRANAAEVLFNLETKRVADDPQTIDDGFDGINAGPLELALLAAIEAAGVTERTTVQSFDHRSLWAVAATGSEVALAALSSRSLPDFGDLAKGGASVWSPNQSLVSPASLENAHAAGLAVIPWTVNDPDDMQRLLELGADGIITDRPDLAPGRR